LYEIAMVSALSKTIMLTLVITQASMMLVTGVLIAVVTYKLSQIGGRVRGMKDLLARLIGLIFALFIGIPNLGILAFLAVMNGWILPGTTPSYWRSPYQTNIAFLWVVWAEFVTELLWMCAIAYAMRTVVKRSWLIANFKSWLGLETGSTNGSGGTMSGGSGSHSSFSVGATFNDDA
jgi:hypothetical protein